VEAIRVSRRRHRVGRVRARHVGKAAVWGFSPTWRAHRARITTALATLFALLALGVAAYTADAMRADAARDARERELMCQRVGALCALQAESLLVGGRPYPFESGRSTPKYEPMPMEIRTPAEARW